MLNVAKKHETRWRTPLALLSTILLMALLGHQGSQAASPKRGWAGAGADWVNATNSSWYYNWWHTRPGDDASAHGQFIPLIKFYSTPENLQNKLNLINSYQDVDTLLVLNEPERADQSNVSVQDAIGFWPQIQESLPGHKLVSPAVSDDGNGQAWLDSFMSQVEARNSNGTLRDDLRVDAVAFHWYGASSPDNPIGAANQFLSRVDWYHNTYNRPVWITEFAMHDWGGNYTDEEMRQANATFLDRVIPALESRGYVEGYSFYNWFSDSRIVEGNPLTPTVVGDQYVDTTLAGETRDLGGISQGTDVVYLRGGTLTNTGAAIPDAMRGLDVLGGISTISGTEDWAVSTGSGSYSRIHSGGVLRKRGAAKVTLTSAVTIDGTLQVEEGTLELAYGAVRGAGNTHIGHGATLQVTTGSRNPYAFQNHDVTLAGTIDGPVLISSGSSLTTESELATVKTSLAVSASVLDIGGSGFTAGPPAAVPISAGLQFDFDAARDAAGDNFWSDASGLAPNLGFAQPASPVPVVDAAFSALTAAYSIPTSGSAAGLNNYFELESPRSTEDATFEIVFKVDSLVAGADQVLMEVGGVGRGAAFVLNDDILTFNVDGDAGDVNLTHAIQRGWNQAIGVIDLDAGGDIVSLYVNGQRVGVATGQTINDWAGGNPAGVGGASSSVTGVSTGLGNIYHGEIALAKYYGDTAFDTVDAEQNFAALQSSGGDQPSTLLVDGNFSFQNGSVLRLDIGDQGASDRLQITGTANFMNGTLEVNHIGDNDLVAGDAFDLFDFFAVSGELDLITLPQLSAGLTWFDGNIMIDGTLLVTFEGDFNGDGAVDAADYTIWREELGTLYDSSDYVAWRNNYGAGFAQSSAQSSGTVPEPVALWTMLSALWCISSAALSRVSRCSR